MLPRRERPDGSPHRDCMRREDLLDQPAPRRREGEQRHPAVGGARPPPHEAPLAQLVHDVGRAARLDQDAALYFAHRQLSLVVEHFQDSELGGAESETGDAGARVPVHRVKCSRQDDPQLERGGAGGGRGGW